MGLSNKRWWYNCGVNFNELNSEFQNGSARHDLDIVR